MAWNPDLLLRLGIKARACFPLLFHQFPKAGQDKFAVLLSLFVCERAQRIEEYSSDSFVGLSGFGERNLKFCFRHVLSVMAAASIDFKERRVAGRAASGLFFCWSTRLSKRVY